MLKQFRTFYFHRLETSLVGKLVLQETKRMATEVEIGIPRRNVIKCNFCYSGFQYLILNV